MSMWDRKLLDKLKKLGISVVMYKRYVDDMYMVLNGSRKGWAYSKKDKNIYGCLITSILNNMTTSTHSLSPGTL